VFSLHAVLSFLGGNYPDHASSPRARPVPQGPFCQIAPSPKTDLSPSPGPNPSPMSSVPQHRSSPYPRFSLASRTYLFRGRASAWADSFRKNRGGKGARDRPDGLVRQDSVDPGELLVREGPSRQGRRVLLDLLGP